MSVMWRMRSSVAALAAAVLAATGVRAQDAPPPDPAPAAPAGEAPPAEPAPPVTPPAPAPPSAVAPPPAAAPAPPATAPPPPVYAPPPPLPGDLEAVRAATPPPGSARVPADDPQADRGVIAPTAYTHPKGTFYVSDYELAFVQFGYAFTDDTQISVTGVPPVSAERIFVVDLTLKTTLYRGGRVRVAALGSTSGIAAKELGVIGVGRVGGVVQLCLAGDCASSLSLTTDVTLMGFLLMLNGATAIYRLGRVTSLLGELDTLVPLGKEAGELNGALVSGGLRFGWTNWGVDAVLLHTLGGTHVTGPFVALTYRSLP
jgi:hypothetical protein